MITRWTPVKNLTFSADLAYVMLDQKFAGGTTFAAPAAVGVAKPAAIYEFKDQNAVFLRSALSATGNPVRLMQHLPKTPGRKLPGVFAVSRALRMRDIDPRKAECSIHKHVA